MDLISALPTDNSPVSPEDKHYVDMISNSIKKESYAPPVGEAHPTRFRLDTMWAKIKHTLILGFIAGLIFSPLIDCALGGLVNKIVILIIKIVLFMAVHYFLFMSKL